MGLSKRDMEYVSQFLSENEKTLLVLKQSYLASISPDTIVATDSKVLIVKHSFWGLHVGHNILSRTNVATVPYKNILGIDVSHGLLLSTVNLHLLGSSPERSSNGNVWSMAGIRRKDSNGLMDVIRKFIEIHAKG
ncbi:MAG: PH domain-containing protein [Candidatus Micrarchaeota archaeon]|nr:PH domain-containing protein [Candidatus Micrarchaeota archaeon]MDE1824507.1 PH domain-containing protein [Candidatus Micrarchaeota archaeon]MDE1850128.1 PH domain-containing protein [Candidatus Micrarchaeota archaeon]